MSARSKTRVTAVNKPRAACTILCRSVTHIGFPKLSLSIQVMRLIASPTRNN